ncbi:MAG: D-2-hydroxyacid dehydrogenase [Pseudomonadales bacterium]|nr:D-2-hydroxyacid dehydrogenase [Pseudomonadales bacterium]
MKGVILDANSLGDVNLEPIITCLDHFQVYQSSNQDQIETRIADADIILTNKTELGRKEFAYSPRLKLISVMATGTNNIDLLAAEELNIQVSNAVAYATPSVVQHTINLMLCLSTHLIDYIHDTRQGLWQTSNSFCRLDHSIVELSGKKLGVIGYGELGKNVAKVAEAFGMEILIAQDTTVTRDTSMAHLLAKVDYLSLHCPLNDKTTMMINKTTLSQMKPTAFLINTARGGLVNSNDLVHALEQGIIAGAAIDVLSAEPANESEPLIQASHLKNLLITPHNAWGAIESRNRLVKQTRENIDAFLAGKILRRVTPS